MSDSPTTATSNRMSDVDALMWTVERNPALRSTMTSVSFFDEPLDRPTVTDRIDRMTRVIPRLRQRVVGNPMSIAAPRWEIDPYFDLSYHLRWLSFDGKQTERDILDLAEPLVMAAFDRDRPLWETTCINGLAGGGAALIMKAHHSVTDGLGALRMQMELFDFDADPVDKGPMPDAPIEPVLGQTERTVDAIAHELRAQRGALNFGVEFLRSNMFDPLGTTRSVAEGLASAGRLLKPVDRPLSPLLTERTLSVRFDTLILSLPALKAAGKRIGSKLNDAFVAGLCLGLQRYHQRHGVVLEALRFGIPVNQRADSADPADGNHWAPVRFELPMHADPDQQMTEIRNQMAESVNEPALSWITSLAGVLRRLPNPMSTAVFAASLRGTDVQASNVPGSRVPMYLTGSRLRVQYPFGPLASAALNVTLLSYQDELHLGIASNPGAVGDPEALIDDLEAGFTAVIG